MPNFMQFVLTHTAAKSLVETKAYDRIYSRRIRKQAKKLLPTQVNFETTNFCNANCIMCPHSKMRRKKNVMPLSDFKKYCNQIMPYLNIKRVMLTGLGEPLLDPTIYEKIAYIKKKWPHIYVYFFTNGALLDVERGKKLIKSGIDEISISFNGGEKKDYEKVMGLEFEPTLKNIMAFLRYRKKNKIKKPLVKISCVLIKDNEGSEQEYINLFKNYADSVVVKPAINWAGTKKDFKRSKKYKEKAQKNKGWACRGIWSTVDVQVDGKIVICCNDYEQKMPVGDLNKQTIKEVLNSPQLNKIKELHLNKQFDKIELCKNCDTVKREFSSWWQ